VYNPVRPLCHCVIPSRCMLWCCGGSRGQAEEARPKSYQSTARPGCSARWRQGCRCRNCLAALPARQTGRCLRRPPAIVSWWVCFDAPLQKCAGSQNPTESREETVRAACRLHGSARIGCQCHGTYALRHAPGFIEVTKMRPDDDQEIHPHLQTAQQRERDEAAAVVDAHLRHVAGNALLPLAGVQPCICLQAKDTMPSMPLTCFRSRPSR